MQLVQISSCEFFFLLIFFQFLISNFQSIFYFHFPKFLVHAKRTRSSQRTSPPTSSRRTLMQFHRLIRSNQSIIRRKIRSPRCTRSACNCTSHRRRIASSTRCRRGSTSSARPSWASSSSAVGSIDRWLDLSRRHRRQQERGEARGGHWIPAAPSENQRGQRSHLGAARKGARRCAGEAAWGEEGASAENAATKVERWFIDFFHHSFTNNQAQRCKRCLSVWRRRQASITFAYCSRLSPSKRTRSKCP